jgi:phage tail-like protein
MARAQQKTKRFDPYKAFKFHVKWDGRYVAGVSKISALKRTTEVVEHREGGDPSAARTMPGRTRYEPIMLERGVTHDTEFERWANSVSSLAATADHPQANFRKDLMIDIFDEAGRRVLSYKVYGAWVSEYQALPALDATTRAVAIEHIVLQHEGWERDPDVTGTGDTKPRGR